MSFTAEMRSATNRGSLWSDIGWSALAVGGVVLGTGAIVAQGSTESKLFGVAILIGALGGLYYISSTRWRRLRLPASDPLAAQLVPYGSPAMVDHDIDADFSGTRFTAGNIHIGVRWLCFTRRTQVTVRRLDALVWAYPERIGTRLNGIIPIGRARYQIRIWDRTGRGAALRVARGNWQPTLAAIQRAAPWILTGHTDTHVQS